MKTIHLSTQTALSRRSFLRGTGVALSLPLPDAMQLAFAHTSEVIEAGKLASTTGTMHRLEVA